MWRLKSERERAIDDMRWWWGDIEDTFVDEAKTQRAQNHKEPQIMSFRSFHACAQRSDLSVTHYGNYCIKKILTRRVDRSNYCNPLNVTIFVVSHSFALSCCWVFFSSNRFNFVREYEKNKRVHRIGKGECVKKIMKNQSTIVLHTAVLGGKLIMLCAVCDMMVEIDWMLQLTNDCEGINKWETKYFFCFCSHLSWFAVIAKSIVPRAFPQHINCRNDECRQKAEKNRIKKCAAIELSVERGEKFEKNKKTITNNCCWCCSTYHIKLFYYTEFSSLTVSQPSLLSDGRLLLFLYVCFWHLSPAGCWILLFTFFSHFSAVMKMTPEQIDVMNLAAASLPVTELMWLRRGFEQRKVDTLTCIEVEVRCVDGAIISSSINWRGIVTLIEFPEFLRFFDSFLVDDIFSAKKTRVDEKIELFCAHKRPATLASFIVSHMAVESFRQNCSEKKQECTAECNFRWDSSCCASCACAVAVFSSFVVVVVVVCNFNCNIIFGGQKRPLFLLTLRISRENCKKRKGQRRSKSNNNNNK